MELLCRVLAFWAFPLRYSKHRDIAGIFSLDPLPNAIFPNALLSRKVPLHTLSLEGGAELALDTLPLDLDIQSRILFFVIDVQAGVPFKLMRTVNITLYKHNICLKYFLIFFLNLKFYIDE